MSLETFVKPARFPSFPQSEPPEPPARKPIVSEVDTAREAARREGLAHGREEGRAAALAEWTPRLTALAAALEDTIAVARTERERLASELTRLVPQVALHLAQKVIERELATPEGAVRTVVDAVTRRLTEGGAGTVRVAPDIAAALDAWRVNEHAAALTALTIRADEALKPGDWVIETDRGLIDGRLETQFEEAARILLEPEA